MQKKSDSDRAWQTDPQQARLKRRVRNFSLHGTREYPRGDDLTHQIHSENPWIIYHMLCTNGDFKTPTGLLQMSDYLECDF